MRKMFVSIGVVVLVVILPAGSWFYLQTGLDYRKAALKELAPKGLFDTSIMGGEDNLKSETTLIQLETDQEEISSKVFDQFGEAETFHLWTPSRKVSGSSNWSTISDASQAILHRQYPDASFILLDTAMQVRHVYNEPARSVIKDLITHIAIVLPRKKDKDIKMKTKTQ